jgi:hypothetical protein
MEKDASREKEALNEHWTSIQKKRRREKCKFTRY